MLPIGLDASAGDCEAGSVLPEAEEFADELAEGFVQAAKMKLPATARASRGGFSFIALLMANIYAKYLVHFCFKLSSHVESQEQLGRESGIVQHQLNINSQPDKVVASALPMGRSR